MCIYYFSNSFPIRLLQNIEQSSLCYTVGPFLVFYFKYSSVLTTVLEKILETSVVSMGTFIWERYRETNSASHENRWVLYWELEKVGRDKEGP